MFYKQEFPAALGSFASSGNWFAHVRRKVMEDIDRILLETPDHSTIPVNYTPDDLTYLWALNLELGVETLAIHHKDFKTPLVIIDRPMPWKDQPHHRHMAEFVNHHVGRSVKVQRKNAAEFVIRQLNQISKWALRKEFNELDWVPSANAAKLALDEIDGVKE